MKILGIESSCDETAAAIVEDGTKVLSSVVNSQVKIHAKYGGVVPEIAARSHIEAINPVINQALAEANLSWDDIDAIAVTNGPGLSGSLLVGTLAARTLAVIKNKPFYPVDHILSHFYANFLSNNQIEFPVLSLTVSGGHSQLVLFKDQHTSQILGSTTDDAVGEAFDKVAKVIGLSYPGGPAIEQAAKSGQSKFRFTKPRTQNKYDFSFSGLKTAVLRQAQAQIGQDYSFPSFKIAQHLSKQDQLDLAASFQATAIDILTNKTKLAYDQYQPKTVALAGGVSANKALRDSFQQQFPKLIMPNFQFCTDNAAMVAAHGFFWSQVNQSANPYQSDIKLN